MQKNKLLFLLVVLFALVFSGVSMAQEPGPLPPPPPPDSFFDVFFEIETPEDWSDSLFGDGSPVQVQPFSPVEWRDYTEQWWNPDWVMGDPYPQNKFFMPELYVYEGGEPEFPDAGLIMTWGEGDLPPDSYSSAWKLCYDQDPDLSNTTITITVVPPQFDPASGTQINVVSFGMRDANNNVRAWYWNVGGASMPWNVPTTITINTAVVGVGATNPMATSFLNNPSFDITQVLAFIVDENAVWQPQTVPPPPPGQTISRPWNLWNNLSVKPNPGNRLNVGININVHQDNNKPPIGGTADPALDPDDFHVEGRIESGLPLGAPGGGNWSDPPVLVDHADGPFPDFGYSITPDYSDPGENWYIFQADWKGAPVPYCTTLDLGLKFDVVCHNIIIDLVGWWTLGGQPYPNANQGKVQIPGFDVQDNIVPDDGIGNRVEQFMTLSYKPELNPDIAPPRLTQLGVAVLDAKAAKALLGDRPLQQLNEEGAAGQLLFTEVIRNDLPVSEGNPMDFAVDSFFDIYFDIEIPHENHTALATPINATDVLIIRQEVEYPNSDGVMEKHWQFEIHEAHSQEADLGDAPDSTNSHNVPMTAYPWGVQANYPTVYRVGSPAHGPIHWFPHQMAYLGQNVTVEQEADLPPDQDPTTNIIPLRNLADLDKADDGLVTFPLKLPNCLPTTFKYQVNLVNPMAGQPMYFNAWLDMDRDGDWNDVMACPQGPAPEWIVQNQDVMNALGGVWAPGLYTVQTPQFLVNLSNTVAGTVIDPQKSPVWLRITLSETPWQGSGAPTFVGGSGPPMG
ncbi:MAG: hypothetical protein GY869_06250, partial [Planctomycetes bacterium]|nr:hypothetical protein [Planctomycetota bacterium]